MQDSHHVNLGALFSEVSFSSFISHIIDSLLLLHRHIVFNLKSEKVKNWRTYFTFSGLATALVLGLIPSLWDSVSDFLLAKEEETTRSLGSMTHPRLGYSWSSSTYLTYLFICLPLHYWTASTGLQMILPRLLATKCYSRCSQNRVCIGTAN